MGKGLVSLCHRQCFTLPLADFDIYSFPIQLTDEIDLRKCYRDVDKKFRGERGIILNLDSWRKLVKAVNYVDRRIKVVEAISHQMVRDINCDSMTVDRWMMDC